MKMFFLCSVAFFLLAFSSHGAEDFHRMSEDGCREYAKDALRVAVMRDAGVTQEDVLRVFGGLRVGWYSEKIWPYFEDLVLTVYSSKEDPKTWAVSTFEKCLAKGGLSLSARI